jgi:hypothetical protein
LASYDLSSGFWSPPGQWPDMEPVSAARGSSAIAAVYPATISRGGSSAHVLKLSGMGRSLLVRRIR